MRGARPISPRRMKRLAAVAACLFLQGALSGEVSAAGACAGWFPDLRCERQGRFDGFHKPIVAFALFEDPFITTGIYPRSRGDFGYLFHHLDQLPEVWHDWTLRRHGVDLDVERMWKFTGALHAVRSSV